MKELAIRCGFKPWAELSREEQENITTFIKTKWPLLVMDASLYYWKESVQSSREWISFNVDGPA